MFRQKNRTDGLNLGNIEGNKEHVKQRTGLNAAAAPPAKRGLRQPVHPVKDGKKDEVNQELPKIASLAKFRKDTPQSSSCVPIDIFDDEQMYLHYLERARPVPADFLNKKAITPKMRTILFDWLVQIQDRFSFAHDTLHLAWILIDRSLIAMNLKKDKLQLLGATCAFLAAKYEEVAMPHISDFVFLAASSFTRRDLTQMERELFRIVNFNLGYAYPIQFLRRYRYVIRNNEETHQASKLFCDIFMSVYETSHKLPSVMAQVALYLAFFMYGLPFPENAYEFMGTTERELKKECSDFVGHIHNFCTTSKETTLHRKYRAVKSRISASKLDLLMSLKRY